MFTEGCCSHKLRDRPPATRQARSHIWLAFTMLYVLNQFSDLFRLKIKYVLGQLFPDLIFLGTYYVSGHMEYCQTWHVFKH